MANPGKEADARRAAKSKSAAARKAADDEQMQVIRGLQAKLKAEATERRRAREERSSPRSEFSVGE